MREEDENMELVNKKNMISGSFTEEELSKLFHMDVDTFLENERNVKKLAFAILLVAERKGYGLFKCGDNIVISVYQEKKNSRICTLTIKKESREDVV